MKDCPNIMKSMNTKKFKGKKVIEDAYSDSDTNDEENENEEMRISTLW